MSLSEGSGSEILGEKPRSSAAFCLLEKSKSPPPKEGGVPHYLESQHPHSQLKQISTYTRTRIHPNPFPPSGRNWPCVPRFWPGGAPWLPCTAGHAVAGPVWPDHAGGGRLAPPMPARRPTLPQTPLATAHRVTSPVVSQTPPTSRVQGRAPRLEAPPRQCLRPAQEWSSWVPVQAFGPHR
jgi:hypothetical protein